MSKRGGSFLTTIVNLKTARGKVINKIHSEAGWAGGPTRLFPAENDEDDEDTGVRIDEIFFNPITRQKMIEVQLNREVDRKTKKRVIKGDTHAVLARVVLNTNWRKDQEEERKKEWKTKVDSILDQIDKEKPFTAKELNMPGYEEAKAMAKLEAQGGRKLSRSEKKKEKEAEAAQNQRSRSNSRTRVNSRPPTRGSGGGGGNSH